MYWSMTQVRSKLDEMIRTAGYDDLADSVDMDAVRTAADQVEEALRTEPETV